MSSQELKNNINQFFSLMETMGKNSDEIAKKLLNHYVQHHINLVNEILIASVDNLKKLENIISSREIICAQTQFTSDLINKFSKSSQNFLNASLEQIADYNEWLKAHCDYATD